MTRAPRTAAGPLAVLLLALAGPAAAWQASNGATVDGSAAAISVDPQPGASGHDIFCAAAEYARSRLGAAPTDRLTVTSPRQGRIGQPGGGAVGFALAANAALDHGVVLRASRAGETVSVGHLTSACRESTPSRLND